MTERIDRFKKLKDKDHLDKINLSNDTVDSSLVNEYLSSEINKDQLLEKETDIFFSTEYKDDELIEMLAAINRNYDDQRLDLLIDDCKNSVLENIIKPFGIGKYIAIYDKVGGNVDTINNVRKGIYATSEEKNIANSNPVYDKKIAAKFHSNKNYIERNKEGSKLKRENKLKDEYTGDYIKSNEKSNLDHTISAKEIHDDRGRVLAEGDEIELANADNNLNHTHESINKAKKQKDVKSFIKELEKNKEIRQAKIKELSSKNKLTDREKKQLEKLKEQDKIDSKLMEEKDEKARKEYNSSLNKKYYESKKFVTKAVKTSGKEGVKMGMQQAVGLVLNELTVGVFDEIIDMRHNGFKTNQNIDESFFVTLKVRMLRIGEKVLKKWKDVVAAFGSGFFSGFLSNLITVIINAFKTTSKKAVRLIREGFFSLFKAIKILILPPDDISLNEAAHEATKLIVAGLAITGGILLEESVESFLRSIPFSDMISPVIIGIVTGLTTAFVVYLLDRIDIFGVNEEKRQEFILNELDNKINDSLKNTDDLLKGLDSGSEISFV
jgi:hypothetical protein